MASNKKFFIITRLCKYHFYFDVLVEVHSHGNLPAYFSPTDDTDECSGFRIYGVLGNVKASQPEILLRVGLFGHGWTVSVPQVFEVNANHGLNDLCQTKGSMYYAIHR
jgi:hypothetical protein